jgi:group I intron endonuclease
MKKGRIYKIINSKTDDIYIGSTIQTLKNRFKAHKSSAKLNKTGKLYDFIRDNGIENFTIELLKEIDTYSKKDISIKEKE